MFGLELTVSLTRPSTGRMIVTPNPYFISFLSFVRISIVLFQQPVFQVEFIRFTRQIDPPGFMICTTGKYWSHGLKMMLY
jgi:hypothetical protein